MGGFLGLARRLTVGIALGALLAGALASGATAAPQPLTMSVGLDEGYVYGQVRLNAFVEVAVRDASGKLLGRGLADSYDGYWEFYGFPGNVKAGYKIKATSFNKNGQLEVVKLTVPQLTIAVDRNSNTVSGKGPAGKNVQVSLYDPRWEHWGESYQVTEVAHVDGTGTYSYDFGADGINIRGGAEAMVTWSNAARTADVWRYGYAARIMLGLDDAYFWGTTRRNVHVEATLRDATSNVLAVGHAVGYSVGYFDGAFADAQYEDYVPKAGDRLTAPAIDADVDWQIPAGISTVDVTTDKVSGHCFPNGRYQIYVADPRTYEEAWKYGNANAGGAFTKDMTSAINVRSNSYVEVLCWTAEADYVWDGYGSINWYSSSRLADRKDHER
jgi:hypothetical protein